MKGILKNIDDEVKENEYEGEKLTIDQKKIDCVEHIISLAKDYKTPIVFVKSPRYGGTPLQLIQPNKDICEQNEIPFIDCSNAEEFQDAAYFCDHSHLNAQGARLFSQYIAKNKIIKGLLANGVGERLENMQ